jgi:hypothetical protein
MTIRDKPEAEQGVATKRARPDRGARRYGQSDQRDAIACLEKYSRRPAAKNASLEVRKWKPGSGGMARHSNPLRYCRASIRAMPICSTNPKRIGSDLAVARTNSVSRLKNLLNLFDFLEPPAGFEPATC